MLTICVVVRSICKANIIPSPEVRVITSTYLLEECNYKLEIKGERNTKKNNKKNMIHEAK